MAPLDVPAVMVRVGRDPASRAGSWLRRRADVDVLLERLCQLREASGASAPRSSGAGRGAQDGAELVGHVLGFMKDLWALEQGLNQRSKAMLGRFGVTGPQRLVVRVVGRLGPVSPAQLARVLHLHPSSVTRLTRRLEARSLVRRTPHPSHRGRYLLTLGSRGGRVERVGAGTVESAVRAALKAAGPQDVQATRRVLALVTRRLVRKD
jgi:DNA-binding MarR family transcriptional regulator